MSFESLDHLYRYAKKKYNITYKSIATELNTSVSFICMCIAGKRPIKPENYEKWIKALNAESDISVKAFNRLASMSKTKIKLDLSALTNEQKEIICNLAETINSSKNPDHIINLIKERVLKNVS